MNLNTPQYHQIDNKFLKTNDTTQCNTKGPSNNFGNYFQMCLEDDKSAYWGSKKPVRDRCLQPQLGRPCTSLWNNLTKRKSIVDYKRGEIIQNINIPSIHRLPPNLIPSVAFPPEYETSLKIAPKACDCKCTG